MEVVLPLVGLQDATPLKSYEQNETHNNREHHHHHYYQYPIFDLKISFMYTIA